MERYRVKQLLRELNISPGKYNSDYKDSNNNVQMCCPFHGETRPSCGIDIDDLIGKCFACGEHFNLVKLVSHCLEIPVYKAMNWIEDNYTDEFKTINTNKHSLRRIDDEEEAPIKKRHEMDRLDLALYKSGKAVHSYFYERGFTKETAKKFLVGWDDTRKRITVPVLWEDGAPCGVIGRAVIEMKVNGRPNSKFYKVYKPGNDFKYHIYDGFPVGDIIFPLPHFKPKDGLAVLVEGQYDCMWAHQNGFEMFASTLGSKLVYDKGTKLSKQIELLKQYGVTKVLLLRDDDEAGIKGSQHDYELLKREGFTVYKSSYPNGKNDTQECTKEEIQWILDNKTLFKAPTKLARKR